MDVIANHKRFLKWNYEDLEKVQEEIKKAESGLYPSIVYVALVNHKNDLEERIEYRKKQLKEEEDEIANRPNA